MITKKRLAILTSILFAFVFALPVLAKNTSEKTYIVVFEDGVDSETAAKGIQKKYGADVTATFKYALRAAGVSATDAEIEKIKADENVLYVEENQVYSIADQVIPTGISRIFADSNPEIDIDGSDDYRVDADIAILDTGIDFDHPDLNLYSTIDCSKKGINEGTCEGEKDDGHGHGTHVAGTAAALDNGIGVVGVAPGARLWGVKVLTNYGTGTTLTVTAGIDYVTANAADIEVANMSLSGGASDVIDLALKNAVEAGVTFAVAAGNNAADASLRSPARSPDAITVSAIADFDGLPGGLGEPTCRDDIDDTLVYFSNFGPAVDIAAPGTCIYSTYMEGGYRIYSGTSMASPHVAGAAALVASSGSYTPDEIRTMLLDNGNYNWIDDSGDGIQEPLLDVSNTFVFDPALITRPSQIELFAIGWKDHGWQYTDLSWFGANSLNVDIYRDGGFIETTANDGEYTDEVGELGSAPHTYQLCEESSTVCSSEVTVYY